MSTNCQEENQYITTKQMMYYFTMSRILATNNKHMSTDNNKIQVVFRKHSGALRSNA